MWIVALFKFIHIHSSLCRFIQIQFQIDNITSSQSDICTSLLTSLTECNMLVIPGLNSNVFALRSIQNKSKKKIKKWRYSFFIFHSLCQHHITVTMQNTYSYNYQNVLIFGYNFFHMYISGKFFNSCYVLDQIFIYHRSWIFGPCDVIED